MVRVLGGWRAALQRGLETGHQARPHRRGHLGIEGKESWILVRELGFANVAIGAVAIASLWRPEWRLAGALAGGIFLTLAGLEHVAKRDRNSEENLAMVSDLAIGLVMAVYLIAEL